ncbi:MAG TPA: PAS domain-containing protein [Actinomycetota bacterium]|nr:PAS domain-containing protein [Actinomycetota bacterium]
MAGERVGSSSSEAARLQDLIDGIDAILWETTEDREFTFVSRASEKVLGYPPERWLEDKDFWSSILHPEDRDRVLAAYRPDIEDAAETVIEFRVVTADRRIVYLHDVLRANVDEATGRCFFRGAMTDVTERKLTEERLRALQGRSDLIGQLIYDFAYSYKVRPDGSIDREWATGAQSRVVGLTPTELDELPGWEALIHPDDLAYTAEVFGRLVAGETVESEFRLVPKPGEVRWLRCYSKGLRDKDGVVTRIVGAAQDITDQKMIEEALRESESRFRDLTENLDDVFWVTDADTRRPLYVSPAFESLFGVPRESLISDPLAWQQNIHSDDLRRLTETYGRRIVESTDQEYRVLAANGGVRWVRARTFPVRDASGKVIRIAGIARDVTDRRLSRETLMRSQFQLEEAQRVAHIGSWEWDMVENRLEWSDQLFRLFGMVRSVSGLKFESYLAVVHPDERDVVRRRIEEAADTQDPFEFDHRFLGPNGDERILHARGTVIPDETGKAIRMFGTGQDVTEWRYAEAALEESLALLTSTLESTGDGILVVNRDGAIVSYNRRFKEMWQIPDDVLAFGQDAAAISFVKAQVEDPDGFMARVQEVYADPEMETREQIRFIDGRVFERTSTPHRLGNEVIGTVWSFRDVTAQHQLEDHFRHSQKMQAVGRLAGGVAHDFNNLLQVIDSSSRALYEHLEADDPRRHDVEAVLRASESAASLVKKLLAFSRRDTPHPEPLDLNLVVRDLEELLRRTLGEDMTLSTDLAPDLATTRMDRGHIEQIVVNLAVNARDAMAEGGSLTMSTSNVEIHGGDEQQPMKPGPYVCLAVADTGRGIAPEVMPQIFEPFFTTKDGDVNAGLGLASVYAIVEQADGLVDVESEPGEGSTFRVLLPASREPAAAPVVEVAPPRGSGEHILVVEDEQGVLLFLERTLSRAGYDVSIARSAHVALELAGTSEPVDLVLTDVVMPGMSGIELAENIRRLRPEMRVLFISGYGGDFLSRKTHESEAVLLKPFGKEQLLNAVGQVLQVAPDQGGSA